MDNEDLYYDVAIIGGGLAGLATAISIARRDYKVVLFEKELYPFHKVCGEYISLESLDYLKYLGLPVDEWDLPRMDTLLLSSPGGNMLQEKLPLGGFGVSRFCIDHKMVQIARKCGVHVYEGIRVQDVQFLGNQNATDRDIKYQFGITTDKAKLYARVCCGAFGKRSNLDVKWNRGFVQKRPNALNNFIGVKYHARLDGPRNIISLHNFRGGYCGIAPIEDNKINICYLTTAQNLRDHGNNLQAFEDAVLFRNPFLKKAFMDAELLYSKPLTISQISFEKKEQVRDHILLLGDAAGLITPLCGNGMSMAIRSSMIASKYILQYFGNFIDFNYPRDIIMRNIMESSYAKEWKQTFSSRLHAGRILQRIFANPRLTDGFISMIRPFPFITRSIIRKTHG